MARTQHESEAASIHGEFRWRHFESENIHDGTIEEAASAMHLGTEEIWWAIEVYGRCDTSFQDEEGVDGIVCWKPGEITEHHGEPTGGGYEWPATEAPAE